MDLVHEWERHNAAILRDYLIGTILVILKPNGTWMAPNPAPLSSETVEEVFKVVVASPHYQHQTLATRCNDLKEVRVEDGEITVSGDPKLN